jgi:glycosyltransferase involved in cell wall biosynthesis
MLGGPEGTVDVLLVEPYFTGSHASWAEGYARHSAHEVRMLHLEGRSWKWRMHGGAVTLARRFLEEGRDTDVILATDMLDLTTFLALTRERTAGTPVAVYFHENQITYPWAPGDRDVAHKRDMHYGFINFASALAADAVFFNSDYHRRTFLDELPRLLRHFPDHRELSSVGRISDKSRVLHLGFDFERLEANRPEVPDYGIQSGRPPLILWNHRWEYDKNPEGFFQVLTDLAGLGIEFELAVLGENFSRSPEAFRQARNTLGDRIVRFGYAEEFADYAAWLWAADILPVTSRHDFFGMSVVEAVFCGCYPLLPRRLSYPEIFPPSSCAGSYYDGQAGLKHKLTEALRNTERSRPAGLRECAERFAWDRMAPLYDEALRALV